MLFLQEFFAFLNLMPDLLLISLVLHDQFQLLIQHHHFVQCAVRGIRHLITKLKSPNQSIFAQHSITRRFANIVPAIVIMNGITTIPHQIQPIK